MAKVYIPTVDEAFLRKLKDKGLRLPNAPHWIVARLALARSLKMPHFPDEELTVPLPKERGFEIHMEQLTGEHTSVPDAADYTDAYRLLLSVYHDIDLFSNHGKFIELLQRHILRGIQEIRASWREGNDFHDYLFQELFFDRSAVDDSAGTEISERVKKALGEIGVNADIDSVVDGPRLSRFKLQLASNNDLDRLRKGLDKIPFELGMEEPVTIQNMGGERMVALDIPRPASRWQMIDGANVPDWVKDQDGSLPVCPGTDVLGNPVVFDLAECPHLFVAGTTGSGKSVCLHSILLSLLSSKKPVSLLMIDPKKMDFSAYNGSKKLRGGSVITELSAAREAIVELIGEMEQREALLAKHEVANLSEAQAKGIKLDRIVVVIDELADLLEQEPKAADALARLARMARASGIHLLLSTQRPDAQTFPGQLRSNVPSRIALSVRTGGESKIILDETGAEKLLSRGDMLIYLSGQAIKRAHGAYVEAGHIKAWL